MLVKATKNKIIITDTRGPKVTREELDVTTLAGAVTLAMVKADVDIADALAKKHSNILDHANTLDHTQGTDQGLDTGGANAVTAAQAKSAYTHSISDHVSYSYFLGSM